MLIKQLDSRDYTLFKHLIQEYISEGYCADFHLTKEAGSQISMERIKELDRYMQLDQAILIGIIEEDQLWGFLWAYKHEYYGQTRMHVTELTIDKKHRHEGLGELLMKEVEAIARQLHVSLIDLCVTDENIPAVGLYEKLGFHTERRYLTKEIS